MWILDKPGRVMSAWTVAGQKKHGWRHVVVFVPSAKSLQEQGLLGVGP